MSECHRTESLERHNDDLNDNQTAMIHMGDRHVSCSDYIMIS